MSERLLREVAIPGSHWIRSKNGNLTCHREHLTTEAKVWFYFLRHSLMPTGHISSLNMERVFLLACIVKGRSINVGKIIVNNIRAYANKRSGELFFPTLSCLLCRASGVVVAFEDEDYYSDGTIFAYDLSRILPTPSTHLPRAESQMPSARTPFTSPSPSSYQRGVTSTSFDTVASTLKQLRDHQQLYWQYARDRDAEQFRSLSQQRQQAGAPWPSFPLQILSDTPQNMEDDGDNE